MDLTKKTKTALIHLAGWISYLFLIIWLFTDSRTLAESLARGLFAILIQSIVFYLNYFILLPWLLERRRYAWYFAAVAVVIAFAMVLFLTGNRLFFTPGRHIVAIEQAQQQQAHEFRQRNLPAPAEREAMRRTAMTQRAIIFNGFHILFVLFISTIIRNLEVSRKRDRESLQLRNQVLEAESKMLKWQINPHFLFNTLNNIYSMAQLKLDQTPEAIHRLSEMLRYVIYDCNEPRVPLQQEINYLKSYIELQRLKDDNIRNIRYDFRLDAHGLTIAPLILIAFLENSFKHSKIEDQEKSWIRISLTTQDGDINFTCENTIPAAQLKKDSTPGIGLENVKRRLELLYPGRHRLIITEKEDLFSVNLTIQAHDH